MIKGALDASRLDRLRAATERAVKAITDLDPHRFGNSAHHHRYSFGRASKSGYEHDPDWAVMVDPPAVNAVLTELWGADYKCNGLGGDVSLPGAIGKQGLHSDISKAFKYEVIDTPEARALRPRHYGANNANLCHGRGRLFAKAVPYSSAETLGVEYLPKHDFSLNRHGPCGYLNVDYTTTDWTADIGATQVIRGSHLWPLPAPKLEEEDRAMRHSTLAGTPAGCAIIRDLRLFHAGTPNVSLDSVRVKPAASFVAPWWSSQPDARPMTQRVYRTLSPHGKRISSLIIGEEEDYDAEFYGAASFHGPHKPWFRHRL